MVATRPSGAPAASSRSQAMSMPSRRAAPDAERRALDDVQAQVAGRLRGALARRVGAAVEDEDDLVGVARDAALRGQRARCSAR